MYMLVKRSVEFNGWTMKVGFWFLNLWALIRETNSYVYSEKNPTEYDGSNSQKMGTVLQDCGMLQLCFATNHSLQQIAY